MCVLLQFCVVAGSQHATSTEAEFINDCGGKSGTLGRIGARPRLIEEDHVARDSPEQDSLNRREVTREGTEALRDGLIITNVCPDVPRWRHR